MEVSVRQAERKPLQVIEGGSRWVSLDLAEVWQFRDLLATFAVRDLKLRYRQTALGAIWVILQPLLGAGLFSFIFGSVAKLPSDGVPYFVFSYASLLAWNLFSSILGKSSTSLIGYAHLVSKVYFPRLILPLACVLSYAVDFLVAFCVMLAILFTSGLGIHIGILLLPVWLALITLLALGIGMFAAALTVTYRDVGYVLPVLTQALMYATPVAYAASAVPARLRPYIIYNPLSGLVEATRWSLLGRGSINVGLLAFSAVLSVVVFAAGVYWFKSREKLFADVI